ncbi:Teichoic acid export ATP-binding protein TagH [hydrothermal vent metagenome]|uniref:Teichoic acid export ATP-binding protein TagH n=1 Tax=hydrothermal vent metagenome TaxID=652676 RepID=A0A3B0Z2F4_9ZZZZ
MSSNEKQPSSILQDNVIIQATGLGKKYHLYAKPSDRFKHFLFKKKSAEIDCYHALKPMDLTLLKGEVLGIVGENGAGKSTLLQLICGTLSPSSGEIKVQGRIAALLELGSGFNPEFTGRENVFLNAGILGMNHVEITAKFDEIVAFSGIREAIDQPVKTYSSGMLVRLAFSVATSVDPDVLIIDEALSVGDGAFARKSFERIMQLRQKGTTILFCTHNLYQVEAICTKAIWLKKGKSVAFGQPSEVVKRYEAYLHSVDHHTGLRASDGNNLQDSADAESTLDYVPTKFKDIIVTLTTEQTSQTASLTDIPEGISGKSTLSIKAIWRCDKNSPPPSFAITIHTADSRMVASAGSHSDRDIKQRSIQSQNGQASATVIFEKIPLLKGEYWIEAYLLCEQGILFYDQRIPCARFKIKQEHNPLEQGIFHMNRVWSE